MYKRNKKEKGKKKKRYMFDIMTSYSTAVGNTIVHLLEWQGPWKTTAAYEHQIKTSQSIN